MIQERLKQREIEKTKSPILIRDIIPPKSTATPKPGSFAEAPIIGQKNSLEVKENSSQNVNGLEGDDKTRIYLLPGKSGANRPRIHWFMECVHTMEYNILMIFKEYSNFLAVKDAEKDMELRLQQPSALKRKEVLKKELKNRHFERFMILIFYWRDCLSMILCAILPHNFLGFLVFFFLDFLLIVVEVLFFIERDSWVLLTQLFIDFLPMVIFLTNYGFGSENAEDEIEKNQFLSQRIFFNLFWYIFCLTCFVLYVIEMIMKIVVIMRDRKEKQRRAAKMNSSENIN